MFMAKLNKKELNSMNFIISGKNIEVTAGLRETIEQKLGKLERYAHFQAQVGRRKLFEPDCGNDARRNMGDTARNQKTVFCISIGQRPGENS